MTTTGATTTFNSSQTTSNTSKSNKDASSFLNNGSLSASINKDNIFQQTSATLQQSCVHPIDQEEPKKKDLNTNESFKSPETQDLTKFLSLLALQANSTLAPETQNHIPKVVQPLQIVARGKDGLYITDEHDKDYLQDNSKIIYENVITSLFNHSGTLLAFASPHAIGIYETATKKTFVFDLPNVIALSFSPGQKYLVTIDRRENRFFLSIFQSDPLRKLYEFETCRYKKETWPQLKFTQNDELAFWASRPTQIEVFNPRQNFQIIRTIETKPFDYFAISENMENLLIACIGLEHSAGYDGHEGHIDLYKYKDLEANNTTPMVSKVIDKAHEVTLFFSPTGQNLLIWAQTFTDRTGQSYYGEHMLLYLDLNKKTLKKVPTYKGPIHDVAWNPNGLEFIVISGFMPAGSVLFDSFCVPKFEFGRHHRNTIKWSPLSRFVCLAGFGNLPGDMEIWDVYSLKLVGSCKAPSAVSCKWAPDGRKIMAGVLNPRLRVGNNYKVFKYNGEMVNHVDFSQTELYEILWKPGKYQDRQASPVKEMKEVKEKTEDEDKKEKKVFRPKGGGSFAAQLKEERNKRSGGRYLSPDETFGNEEEEGKGIEKEELEKNKEKEEQAKKNSVGKISRRNNSNVEELRKEGEDKSY